MNFLEYQQQAASFRLPTADKAYVAFGTVGEVGELYGYIAKCIRDEQAVDLGYVAKELGDVLWFLSQLAADMGIDFQKVAELNIKKLAARKENGTIQGSGDDR